eukprot:CAMPEP_0202025040 /NCGR_PEP_ID=MMETSP0905-20130828/55521_1 /ASSEMBLY_ACC=CAM_ASM_000554 /TAXON_ID=420261 /ORGANISM="Thalassiosira antarctica, Strain CCMP982" /LENGTH=58 /DNA_ID=CAMNT_0048587833 /DNA_START=501 /DNA_END=677 /DNA_ORIENTATION=-
MGSGSSSWSALKGESTWSEVDDSYSALVAAAGLMLVSSVMSLVSTVVEITGGDKASSS